MSGEADRDRLESLWTRWQRGPGDDERPALSRAEEQELAAALQADAGLRAALLADERLHGTLAALGRVRQDADGEAFARQFRKRVAAERDPEPFVSSVDRRVRAEEAARKSARTRMSRVAAWALLPAAGFAVAWVVRRPSPQPPPVELTAPVPARAADGVGRPAVPVRAVAQAVTARVARVVGSALVVEQARQLPAGAGMVLHAGAGLMTVGPGSSLAVAYADGTTLELEGDSVLAQLAEVRSEGLVGGGKAALLVRGRLRAHVAPQPAAWPMIITTPHAEATVVGTRFSLAVEARATRLDVQEGRLRLRKLAGGDPVTVGGAEYVLVGDALDLVPTAKPRGTALLVVGFANLTAADERVKKRLERLGLEVRVSLAGPPPPADVPDAAVIVVSSTASADVLGVGYREVPVPLVIWEPNLYDELGMTGPERGTDLGVASGTGEIAIKDPAHALAAGLGGNVAVVALPPLPAGEAGPPRRQPDRWMSYGLPGAHAQAIATWPGRPNRAVIFGYERGAPMVGMSAPARRVGLFLHNRSPNLLTDAGWRLFDAAIVWALGDHR